MKVKVGISNRHIHLCKEDAEKLFGKDYKFSKRNDLSQKGEFACEEVVKVSTDKYEFPHVRVMGPLRDYTQIEINKEDASLLGINPPMRDSSEVGDSLCESVYVEGPLGKYYFKNVVIIANRHIHCSSKDNINYNNKDIVSVKVGDRIMDNVHIKMKDDYELELHIDRVDANEYLLQNGDYIDLE